MSNEKTIKAVEESIAHWVRIYEGEQQMREHGAGYCPLCAVMEQIVRPNGKLVADPCEKCPLAIVDTKCGGYNSAWSKYHFCYSRSWFSNGFYVVKTVNDLSGPERQAMRFFSLLMIKTLERALEYCKK